MKTIVIYKSKAGFVKKYAEWIARDLEADLFEAAKVTAAMLPAYDTVIYGGGLYAAGINGVKLIKRNLGKLQGKRIVVFASGASPSGKEVVNEVRRKNFNAAQQQQVRFFYLRGGFDFQKLTSVDKVLMTLLKWKMKMKSAAKLSPDEKGMLAAYDKPQDFTKKKNIDELITYVTS